MSFRTTLAVDAVIPFGAAMALPPRNEVHHRSPGPAIGGNSNTPKKWPRRWAALVAQFCPEKAGFGVPRFSAAVVDRLLRLRRAAAPVAAELGPVKAAAARRDALPDEARREADRLLALDGIAAAPFDYTLDGAAYRAWRRALADLIERAGAAPRGGLRPAP